MNNLERFEKEMDMRSKKVKGGLKKAPFRKHHFDRGKEKITNTNLPYKKEFCKMEIIAEGIKDLRIKQIGKDWDIQWKDLKDETVQFQDCHDDDLIFMAEVLLSALREAGLYEKVDLDV